MLVNGKIVVDDESLLSESGNVLCYGHFNVIHPGHIRYLEEARQFGSKVYVALIEEESVDKSTRVWYSQIDRAKGVCNLHCVDGVILLKNSGLIGAIKKYKPNVLVLGKEYEVELHETVALAVAMQESLGGEVRYHSGVTHYASADLLHTDLKTLGFSNKRNFLSACKNQNLTLNKIVNTVHNFKSKKLLILGDSIVDEYSACEPLGMSAEAPVIVVSELESKKFIGGAAIVAAHIASLGASAHYISVVGNDANSEFLKNKLSEYGVNNCLIYDETRPTTYKKRYIVGNQKLFRVSNLKSHNISKKIEACVIEKIEELAPIVDGILVSDFVYGVITPKIIDAVISISKKFNVPLFGDQQASSQLGNLSILNSFTVIAATEREARLAIGNKDDGIERVAFKLKELCNCENLIIKLGAQGLIAYEKNKDNGLNREHFSALNPNPLDIAGAGDSFLAALAAAYSSGSSIMESSAIGSCVAALAVGKIGNEPVTRGELISFINSLEEV